MPTKQENYERQSRHARTRCTCRSMTPWPDCCNERLLGTTSPPEVGVGTPAPSINRGGGSPSEQTLPKNVMSDIEPQRDELGRLLKGNTPNKGGRSKIVYVSRKLAERTAPEALGTLIAIMRSAKSSLKLKKECAVEILDRGGVYRTTQPKNESTDDQDEEFKVEWNDDEIDKLLTGGDVSDETE